MEEIIHKYHDSLSQLGDCPPSTCKAEGREGYRWVHSPATAEDFIPLALESAASRRPIDESDLENRCRSWGLSFFDTLQIAKARFEKVIKNYRAAQKASFIQQKGDSVALIRLQPQHGTSSPSNNEGHFTLYQYEGIRLHNEIENIFNIFDTDGELSK
jgi:hypothetical protein